MTLILHNLPQERHFFKENILTLAPALCIAHREKGAGEAAQRAGGGGKPVLERRYWQRRQACLACKGGRFSEHLNYGGAGDIITKKLA